MAETVGGSVIWNLDVDPSKFETGLRSAKNKAEDFGAAVNKIDFKGIGASAGNTFSGIADSIANVAQKIAILTVGSGGLGAVFLKSAADLQQTSKSFEVLTGNVQVANDLFAKLAGYANNTPFEFPDIAKAGQILLGFGISSDKVFGDIQMLGDIAAATGADFTSLALVFGQVNATGRLMGQDALQLINNKIPVTSILAKKLGVSVQEVKRQMEAGTISADLFNAALKEQTQAGGFAFRGTEILAQSLNGRLSTLKDTVLEFGRNLLGVKVDPKLGLVIEPGGIFDRISNMIPKIIEKLKEIGPAFQTGFKWIIDNGETIKGIVAGIATAFIGFKILGIVAPLIGTFMAALAGGASIAGAALAVLGGPITLIGIAIVALLAGLAFLQVKFDIFGKAAKFLEPVLNIIKGVFSDLWTSVKDLASVIGKELAPVFEFLSQHAEVFKKIGLVLLGVVFAPLIIAVGVFMAGIKLLAVVLGFIADHFQTIKKIVMVVLAVAFAPLIAIIAPIVLLIKNWGKIMAWFGSVFSAIGNVISEVATTIGSVVSTVFNAMVTVVTTVFGAIWNVISPVLEFIKNLFIIVFGGILLVVLTVLTVIKNIIVTAFNFWWGVISTVMSFIWNTITTIWNAIWTTITTVVGWIWDRLVNAFNFYKDLIVGVFTAIWNFISDIWNKIYGAITGVVQSIINFFAPAATWLFNKGKDIVQGLINGIRNLANAVWEGIKFVADKIGNFFSGAASWLYETGKAIVQGMINGIKDMVNNVKNAAGEVGDAVKNKVKGLLGISSPSKVFYGYGQNITQGLIDGIDKGMNKVDMAAEQLSMGIQAPTVESNMNDNTGSSGNTTISVQPNFSGIVARSRGEWRDIMKDGIESINEELRSRNLPELGDGKIVGVSTS